MPYTVYMSDELFVTRGDGRIVSHLSATYSESISTTADMFSWFSLVADVDSTGVNLANNTLFTSELRCVIFQNLSDGAVAVTLKASGETSCDLLLPGRSLIKVANLDPTYAINLTARTIATRVAVWMFGEQS